MNLGTWSSCNYSHRKNVDCKCVVCKFPVSICGSVLPVNLVVLPIFSYDIILRINWLVRHLEIINCAQKQVTLKSWGEGETTYVGS